MNRLLTILCLLNFVFGMSCFAQTKGDYVILANNDTLPVEFKKIRQSRVVVSTRDGVKKKYRAKDISGFSYKNEVSKSGRASYMIIGFKTWKFLRESVGGRAGLYYIVGYDKDLGRSDETRSVYEKQTVYFIRKEGMKRGKLYKIFSWNRITKTLGDCPEFLKMDTDDNNWSTEEAVRYYNAHCGYLK